MVRSGGPGRPIVPVPKEEAGRIAAVRRYEILDTPPDGAFDRVAALAARLLDAPMASVTIMDRDRIWFKALHGLAGVSQTGRDPGLCSSAVCSDDTLVIPDTLADPVAKANPLVTGPPGVRFYAAAPIVAADGHRLGTVNVLGTRPRTITQADAATLADLAAVVMDQLELRLSALRVVRAEQQRREAEHRRAEAERMAREQAEQDKASIAAFAATLQQTLLPPALPALPGVQLACHYHPASPRDVGGDFYEVFRLDARRWGFFLGDVCGKGAAAAALTSLARYTPRAAAHHGPDDPAAVLSALNDALLTDPAVDGRFCTACYGVLETAEDGAVTVTLAGGGHPPAWHLTPGPDGVRAQPVELTGGTLIGVLAAALRHHNRALGAGRGRAVLYRRAHGSPHLRRGLLGQDGLAAFLTQRGDGGPVSAGQLVADAVALLEELSGGVRDDVALLAFSVPRACAPDCRSRNHHVDALEQHDDGRAKFISSNDINGRQVGNSPGGGAERQNS